MNNYIMGIPALYTLAVSIPLIWYDIRERRLPNKLILPGLALSWMALIVGAFLGQGNLSLTALLCSLGTFVVAILLNALGVIGMGDVKLLALVAVVIGWYAPLAVVILFVLPIVTSLIVGVIQLLTHRSQGTIPLGAHILMVFIPMLLMVAS